MEFNLHEETHLLKLSMVSCEVQSFIVGGQDSNNNVSTIWYEEQSFYEYYC